MTRLSIARRNGQLVVEARGHANYRGEGRDIVCASISMLLYTLAAGLEGAKDLRLESGDARVSATESPDNLRAFELIAKGFEMLSRQYPENVKLNLSL